MIQHLLNHYTDLFVECSGHLVARAVNPSFSIARELLPREPWHSCNLKSSGAYSFPGTASIRRSLQAFLLDLRKGEVFIKGWVMQISYKSLAINGVILSIIALGVLNLIDHVLTDDVVAPCNERYGAYVQFPETVGTGDRLTNSDLELFLDEEIQGLSDYTKVIRPSGEGGGVAFEIRLPKGSSNPRRSDAVQGGMRFAWRPGIPKSTKSACLTYKVWLPQNFKFADGGTLPGLFGGSTPGIEGYKSSDSGFSTHVLWQGKGRTSVRTFTSTMPNRNGSQSRLGYSQLPKGRWVEVSQEVVLNTPGQNDGLLRVWVDGELEYNAIDMLFRKNSDLQVAGVLGDVFYGNSRRKDTAPGDTYLRITPFILNWN